MDVRPGMKHGRTPMPRPVSTASSRLSRYLKGTPVALDEVQPGRDGLLHSARSRRRMTKWSTVIWGRNADLPGRRLAAKERRSEERISLRPEISLRRAMALYAVANAPPSGTSRAYPRVVLLEHLRRCTSSGVPALDRVQRVQQGQGQANDRTPDGASGASARRRLSSSRRLRGRPAVHGGALRGRRLRAVSGVGGHRLRRRRPVRRSGHVRRRRPVRPLGANHRRR
jgi:hypothetical protein